MGVAGSITAKAAFKPSLFAFTVWELKEVEELLHRSRHDLSDIFALRRKEFEFLIDRDKLVSAKDCRTLFQILETRRGICDKYEVLCIAILSSTLSSEQKLSKLFDIFNYNNKGYLLRSELQLLFISVTNSVNRVDSTFKPPRKEVISELIDTALRQYARVDRLNSIRKPELITFATEVREIQAYLEAWRGHSSQVLLGNNSAWTDAHFPASETSILPTEHWLSLGLPPPSFIRWRRRTRVGTAPGCVSLFNYSYDVAKNAARTRFYEGTGCVARGFLRQGLIADRHLLNALAVCISQPDTLLHLFSLTEQEDVGRYCVKFFECGGWRSVFVDDRIPCAHDTYPAFCSSSDSLEAFPLILEKGLAKYFGSYGHIAMSSTWNDSYLMMLRMLTGGHVYRRATKELCWNSVETEVVGEDGCALVRSTLTEGSLIAFGRSEVRAAEKRPPDSKDHDINMPPHGRLFPVVGIADADETSPYRYLILRDAWDLVAECSSPTQKVDPIGGHFRTFRVRLEQVVSCFDSIVFCRFPDALRPTTAPGTVKFTRFKPWRSEIMHDHTSGPKRPARFRLQIIGERQRNIRTEGGRINLSPPRSPGGSPAPTAPLVTSSAAVGASDHVPVDIVEEKSRSAPNTSRSVQTGDKAQSKGDDDAEDDGERRDDGEDAANAPTSASAYSSATAATDQQLKPAATPKIRAYYEKAGDGAETPVEIALTVSSSYDWIVAGASSSAPKLRLRIVPSAETRDALRLRKAERVAQEKEEAAAKEKVRALLAGDLGMVDGEALPDDAAETAMAEAKATATKSSFAISSTKSTNQHSQPNTSRSRQSRPSTGGPTVADSKTEDDDGSGNSSRSSSDSEEEEEGDEKPKKKKSKKKKKTTEEEEEAAKMPAEEENPPISMFDVEFLPHEYDLQFAAEQSWLSVGLKLWPGEYFIYSDISFGAPYSKLQRRSRKLKDIGDAPWIEGWTPEPKVWLHLSTTAPEEAIRLTKMSRQSIGQCPRYTSNHLAGMDVPPASWPFMAESQTEASSRGLYDMMTRLREDSEVLAALFLSTARKAKKEEKRRIAATKATAAASAASATTGSAAQLTSRASGKGASAGNKTPGSSRTARSPQRTGRK